MTLTFPVYVTLECSSESEGEAYLNGLMAYARIEHPDLACHVGRPVLGRWDPSEERSHIQKWSARLAKHLAADNESAKKASPEGT